VVGGHERHRLLAVGCGSLVAGASLVALITFASDRCRICVRRRRRRSFLATSFCDRRPRETVATAAPPPATTDNQVAL